MIQAEEGITDKAHGQVDKILHSKPGEWDKGQEVSSSVQFCVDTVTTQTRLRCSLRNSPQPISSCINVHCWIFLSGLFYLVLTFYLVSEIPWESAVDGRDLFLLSPCKGAQQLLDKWHGIKFIIYSLCQGRGLCLSRPMCGGLGVLLFHHKGSGIKLSHQV